jgi:hypothetical protein
MSANLIGRWEAIKRGLEITSMAEVGPGAKEQLVLHRSGIAEMIFRGRDEGAGMEYPLTWEIVGTDLVIIVPVQPMPDVGIDDWTFDASRFSIVELEEDTMILDTRPHGGEVITSYRRIT